MGLNIVSPGRVVYIGGKLVIAARQEIIAVHFCRSFSRGRMVR